MTNPTPPNNQRVPLFPRTTPAYPLPRQPVGPQTGNGLGFTTDPAGGTFGPSANSLTLDYYSYAVGGAILHRHDPFAANTGDIGRLLQETYRTDEITPNSSYNDINGDQRISYANFLLLYLVDPLIQARGTAQAVQLAVQDAIDDYPRVESGGGRSSTSRFGTGRIVNERTGQTLSFPFAPMSAYVIGTRDVSQPAGRQPGVADWYLDHLRRNSIDQLQTGPFANVVIDAYNANVLTLANAYDAQVRIINANPVVIDPYTAVVAIVTAQVKAITDLAAGAVVTITALATAAQNTVNQIKTGTVDPAVAQANAEIARQTAFATATLNSLLAQIDSATKGAVATVQQQYAIIDAEVKRQQANAEATVNATITQAMAQIANATAILLGLVGTVTTIAGQQVTFVLNTLLGVLANVQAQAADRPLFYGALSSPVTITSPTDVVVIPAGGLVVTAD